MLTGEMHFDQLIPEGLEDISCEGEEVTHVQVKSRQERVGEYRFHEVAAFVLDLYERHSTSITKGARLRLVLERSFEGQSPGSWDTSLAESADGSLIAAIRTLAERRRVTIDDDFLSRTAVVVLPWRTASLQTRYAIESYFDVPAAVAEHVVLALRDMTAKVQDENTTPEYPQRATIDGARLRRSITDALSVVDVESLSFALRTGVADVLDLDTPIDNPVFYEGVETQPGHIAAGLPAPRIKETTAAMEALEAGKPVLVTGPSGVGKSTIVWATAYSTRHVLWYRVRRLSTQEDVEGLARLARASRAAAVTPIGFVVDGVGAEAISAWDDLVRRLAGVPFVYLLGSCRSEDLYSVQSLSAAAQVDVVLDEPTARRIFEHLSGAGRTSATYWLEAFRAADGLTMEYTFLLTQGRRLSDVIRDQVARRIRERRHVELEVVALVSTAHRWRGSLPLAAVIQHLGIDPAELRLALTRLLNEHLVAETDGRLTGVHELRSRELARHIHAAPPPTLSESTRAVLSMVESTQLARVVFHALVGEPQLQELVLTALEDRIRLSSQDAATAFEALRTADFQRVSESWNAILDTNGVTPALRPICVSMALIGGDHDYSIFKPEVAISIPALRAACPMGSQLRDELVRRLGPEGLREVIIAQSTIKRLTDLATSLAGAPINPSHLLTRQLTSSLRSMIEAASLEELGELLAPSRDIDIQFAIQLLGLATERAPIVDQLMQWSPWMTGVQLRREQGRAIAEARMLHVSDELTDNLHAKAVEIARLSLRCMPEADEADVQIQLAGGQPLRVGDYVSGESKLQRRYDHTPGQIRWNRRRGAVAGTTVTTLAQTARVESIVALLDDLSIYFENLVSTFVLGRETRGMLEWLEERGQRIGTRADFLVMPIGDPLAAGIFGDDQNHNEANDASNDYSHTLIDGIVNNLAGRLLNADPHWPSLCAFVGDTLSGAALKCTSEPWELVGLTEPPASLARITELLIDLRVTLAELAFGSLTIDAMRGWATTGQYGSAASRVARKARERAMMRGEQLRLELQAEMERRGVYCQIFSRESAKEGAVFWPPVQFAVRVECQDVSDWLDHLDAAVSAVHAQDASWGARAATLIVPRIANANIRQLGISVITSPLPDTSLYDSWSATLGEAANTPLHNAVTTATTALQAISAIAELRTVRPLGEVPLEFAARMGGEYDGAIDSISRIGRDDPVIQALFDYLQDLELTVQTEINEGVGTASFAARIAAGAIGEESDEYTVLLNAGLVALQRDLDPTAANQLLARLDGEGPNP
jgi:hypothetical protein